MGAERRTCGLAMAPQWTNLEPSTASTDQLRWYCAAPDTTQGLQVLHSARPTLPSKLQSKADR